MPEDDVLPVLLKYQDGYHYQNLLAPLVKLEADHDREQCEAQAGLHKLRQEKAQASVLAAQTHPTVGNSSSDRWAAAARRDPAASSLMVFSRSCLCSSALVPFRTRAR